MLRTQDGSRRSSLLSRALATHFFQWLTSKDTRRLIHLATSRPNLGLFFLVFTTIEKMKCRAMRLQVREYQRSTDLSLQPHSPSASLRATCKLKSYFKPKNTGNRQVPKHIGGAVPDLPEYYAATIAFR